MAEPTTDPGAPPRVLAFCDYYLPGFRAGGPIRTLAGLVEQLGEQVSFELVTRNHDFRDPRPYADVPVDEWTTVGNARVRYASRRGRSLRRLRALIRAGGHDVVYLNSLFSPAFTIKTLLLRRLGLLPQRPVILAPRGELAASALGLKRLKKELYLAAARTAGLYRGVVWQASSELEEADIRRRFGSKVPVVVAPDLAAAQVAGEPPRAPKEPGELTVAFVARVARTKNLAFALRVLGRVRGRVVFDIYGPREDVPYWDECEQLMHRLPENVTVRYHGELEHAEVAAVLHSHHLMFLPTIGENFGHSILEALLNGCPVLISDQTKWKRLEQLGVGWDLPLADESAFAGVIERCVAMGPEEHARMSAAASKYGVEVVADPDALERNRSLFAAAAQAPVAAAAC